MAIIIDRKKVLDFTYRDIHVIIVEATEGADCCGEDRSPHLKQCPQCQAPLEHKQVTLAFTNDQILHHMDRVTPHRARREAERLIDQVMIRVDKLKPADDEPKDKTDSPKGKSNGQRLNGHKAKGPPRPPPKHRPKRPMRPPNAPFKGGDDDDFDDDDDFGGGPGRHDDGDSTYPPLPPGLELPGVNSSAGAANRMKEIFQQISALGWGARGIEMLNEEKRRQVRNSAVDRPRKRK